MHPAEHRFEDMTVGMRAERTITISDDMIDRFADLTGDMNPLHTDDAYARSTPHRGRVAHGLLTAALMSEMVGMRLPGRRALILSEEMRFMKPVRPQDTLTVVGTVSNRSEAARTVTVSIDVMRDADIVAKGTVVTMVEEI